MELTEAIYHRRAVRDYTSHDVSKEILRELIDAAIQAPSALNEQPWAFARLLRSHAAAAQGWRSTRFSTSRTAA